MRISDWSSDVCSSDLIRTKFPYPSLPSDLANIGIVRAVHTGASPQDFEGLAPAIGTGPYRLARWTPRDSVLLRASDAYWGDSPRWREVALRWIPDETEALSALLRNEVQLIGTASPIPLQKIAQNPELSVSQGLRSEEGRVGKECVRTWRPRGSP